MKYSDLNSTVIFTPIVAPVDEDSQETFGTPITMRASVKQIDGTRYLQEGELRDRAVYKIITWANELGHNFKITYNSLTLLPIRPVTENQDKESARGMITIIAAVRV